jgi:hypothetical protein
VYRTDGEHPPQRQESSDARTYRTTAYRDSRFSRLGDERRRREDRRQAATQGRQETGFLQPLSC